MGRWCRVGGATDVASGRFRSRLSPSTAAEQRRFEKHLRTNRASFATRKSSCGLVRPAIFSTSRSRGTISASRRRTRVPLRANATGRLYSRKPVSGQSRRRRQPVLAMPRSMSLLPIGLASPSLNGCFLVRFDLHGLMKTYLPRMQKFRRWGQAGLTLGVGTDSDVSPWGAWMHEPKGRYLPLSGPRRFIGDLVHFARKVPSAPVSRMMDVRRPRSPSPPSGSPVVGLPLHEGVRPGGCPVRRCGGRTWSSPGRGSTSTPG